MKALILAAGYATRLWPLTLNKPKPLLLIGKEPMIEHILTRVNSINDIDNIYIITNSKFVKNFKDWKKKYEAKKPPHKSLRQVRFLDSAVKPYAIKKKIYVIDDGMKILEKRMGSIGDILFAIDNKRIKDSLVVVAGDNIFDFSIAGFIKEAKKNSPCATIGLFDIKNKILAKKYGIVTLDGDSKITSFEEKPKKPKSTLAAMCLYYFPKEKLKLIKKYKKEKNSLDLAGSFIRWLSQRENVYGYIFEGRWLDIGDKSSLKKANKINWKNRKEKKK